MKKFTDNIKNKVMRFVSCFVDFEHLIFKTFRCVFKYIRSKREKFQWKLK